VSRKGVIFTVTCLPFFVKSVGRYVMDNISLCLVTVSKVVLFILFSLLKRRSRLKEWLDQDQKFKQENCMHESSRFSTVVEDATFRGVQLDYVLVHKPQCFGYAFCLHREVRRAWRDSYVSAAVVKTIAVPRFRLSYILDVLRAFVSLNFFDESSCLHGASMIIKHFIIRLMHNI